MKIYVSYFYKIRFFRPNVLPLSTAIWDPKWYHANGTQNDAFIDKHGVINGLRAEMFMPCETCENECRGREACLTGDPSTCNFLKHYYEQLKKLDYNAVLLWFQEVGEYFKMQLGFEGEPEIALIVHEAPSNPCSERQMLIKWFAAHEYNLQEF